MMNHILNHALDIMNERDHLGWREENPVYINPKGRFVCTVTGIVFELTSEHLTHPQWQIIPAKKEMVDFDEWYEKNPTYLASNQNEVGLYVWQASAKNRDILYADLMEVLNAYCKEYYNSEGTARVRPLLEKINAVLSTSSTD